MGGRFLSAWQRAMAQMSGLFFIFISVLSFGFHSQARSTTDFDPQLPYHGYLELSSGRVWVEYIPPAAGQAVIITLNGLTYSTEQWADFNQALRRERPGLGILNYDMRHQGRTLAAVPNPKALHHETMKATQAFVKLFVPPALRFPGSVQTPWTPANWMEDFEAWRTAVTDLALNMKSTLTTDAAVDVTIDDQLSDLKELIQKLRGQHPVHLVALSYGGAVALQYLADHPQDIQSIVLMAPFVEKLADQDMWIRMQMTNFRMTFPWMRVDDEKLYNYFLRVLVFATYPSAEPVIYENHLKIEGAYQLSKGASKFRASDLVHRLPVDGKIHLMVAGKDEYVTPQTLETLWNQISPKARGSRIIVTDAKHKIPEDVPRFAAQWVATVVDGEADMKNGSTFISHSRSSAKPQLQTLGASCPDLLK